MQVLWELRAMNIWKSLTGEEWERKRSRKHWDAVEVRHSTFWNNDLRSYVIPSGVSDRKRSRWGVWGWRLGSRRASDEWMMGSEEVYPWAKWWKEWMKVFRPKKRGDFPSAPLQNRVSPRIDGDELHKNPWMLIENVDVHLREQDKLPCLAGKLWGDS